MNRTRITRVRPPRRPLLAAFLLYLASLPPRARVAVPLLALLIVMGGLTSCTTAVVNAITGGF